MLLSEPIDQMLCVFVSDLAPIYFHFFLFSCLTVGAARAGAIRFAGQTIVPGGTVQAHRDTRRPAFGVGRDR
jgi:hypothetical protein